ncbi:hypothetical protein ACI2KO_07955 [Pseudomonas piscis]|uniref:hypothetical protein n=1 Tax=Pseudomonas piscis TaxID=2614538 RepID=UPI00384FBDAC
MPQASHAGNLDLIHHDAQEKIMANIITVGSITTPNPFLWLNPDTLGLPDVVYVIQSNAPKGDWVDVGQFCAVLSSAWLNDAKHPAKFDIRSFDDPGKIQLAQQVIEASNSLASQVKAAEQAIHGKSKSKDQVTKDFSTYNTGTKIWAGNDRHVIGIYIISATQMQVYDSNLGTATQKPRTAFAQVVADYQLNAFVVAIA